RRLLRARRRNECTNNSVRTLGRVIRADDRIGEIPPCGTAGYPILALHGYGDGKKEKPGDSCDECSPPHNQPSASGRPYHRHSSFNRFYSTSGGKSSQIVAAVAAIRRSGL